MHSLVDDGDGPFAFAQVLLSRQRVEQGLHPAHPTGRSLTFESLQKHGRAARERGEGIYIYFTDRYSFPPSVAAVAAFFFSPFFRSLVNG